MKLTKYDHACFTLEKDGKLLVVDPGEFTSLPQLENVVAVVVTHHHADHLDPLALEALFASNPDMVVYGPEQVDDAIEGDYAHQKVAAGDIIKTGPFTFEFFGGDHAVIHSSFPTDQNVGVMINETVYYPGDSFSEPGKPVKVLALPSAAPWLKIGEAIDYVRRVKPNIAFPTHDAIASDAGKSIADSMIAGFMNENGGEYQRLTQPLDI